MKKGKRKKVTRHQKKSIVTIETLKVLPELEDNDQVLNIRHKNNINKDWHTARKYGVLGVTSQQTSGGAL